MGLVHYRRYLAGSGEQGVLTSEEAMQLLAKAPVVLPKKRNYLIETVESHYAHTISPDHMQEVRTVVATMEPAYLPALEAHFARRKTHICNIFIMRRDVLDAYCTWLFPLLDELDKRIDWKVLSPYHARAVGRVGEYLLDVWLDVQGIDYVEVPMNLIGSKRTVRRAAAFLAAKFLGRKYG